MEKCPFNHPHTSHKNCKKTVTWNTQDIRKAHNRMQKNAFKSPPQQTNAGAIITVILVILCAAVILALVWTPPQIPIS